MTKADLHPKVFISYTHESAAHGDRVRALADRLREDGVDCNIDQYDPSPQEGWPMWMERQIMWADFVLVVFTQTYHRRAMGKEKPGKGQGVTFESVLIRNALYKNALRNNKFITVLFDPDDDRYVIAPLQGVSSYVISSSSPDGYDELYRRLTNQPRVKKPKLGKLKRLPPKVKQTDFWKNVEFISAPPFDRCFPSVVALAKWQSGTQATEGQIENSYFVGQRKRIPRYQSILFTHSQEGLEEKLDIDAALSARDASSNSLFLVPHFRLDVLEILKALSFRIPVGLSSMLGFKQTQWIDGSEMLLLDSARQKRTIDLSSKVGPKGWLLHGMLNELELDESEFRNAFAQIADLPPTCFLVDFSNPSLDRLLGEISAPGTNAGPDWVCRAIENFSDWIGKPRPPHRLIIAMPRFFLAVKPFRDLVERARNAKSALFAAELFSEDYAFRLDSIEKILHRKIPECLRSLWLANSSALIYEMAAFLLRRLHENSNADTELQELSVGELLALSADLARSGFYEIAFRLELFCSTLKLRKLPPKRDVNSLVSLDLDLERQEGNDRKVCALVEGFERIPHALTREAPPIGNHRLRAAMTGKAGAGKTVGLSVIQHWWSLPPLRANDEKWESGGYDTAQHEENNSPPVVLEGKECPAWLPLCLDLTDRESPDLDKLLQFTLKNLGSSIMVDGSRSGAIDLISRYARFDNLRWLLNSPILMLLDGSDSLSRDQRRAASSAIRDHLPTDHGLIVAIRDVVGFPDEDGDLLGDEVRLRPMTRRQFEQLVERKLPHSETLQRQVKDLLHVIDKPLSAFVRTPYVLDKICDLVDSHPGVAGMNLYELMQAYVKRRMLLRPGGNVYRTVHEWLPILGFTCRKTGLPQQLPPGPSYETEASRLGFIRSADQPLQFEHDLLCDYFAAQHLAEAIQKNGVHNLDEFVTLKAELWWDWENVFRILAGRLRQKPSRLLGETIAYLHQIEPRLALSCLRELPKEEVRRIPQAEQVLNSVVSRIEDRFESILNRAPPGEHQDLMREIIADAEALGFLDPRIDDVQTDGSVLVDNMINLGSELNNSAVRIGRYPVTNLEFARFIADGGYREERFWDGLPHAWKWRIARSIQHPAFWDHLELNRPNYPVVGISVYEAIAYCNWLTEKVGQTLLKEEARSGYELYFHLPTEEQWARAEEEEFYRLTQSMRAQLEETLRLNPTESMHLVTEQLLEDARHCADIHAKEISHVDSVRRELGGDQESLMRGPSMPVGLFARNEKGCFDMFGHVWQWCDDWVPLVDEDPLKMADRRPSTTDREYGLPVLVKGGPILDHAGGPSNAIRGWLDPYIRFHRVGFRICCTIVSELED